MGGKIFPPGTRMYFNIPGDEKSVYFMITLFGQGPSLNSTDVLVYRSDYIEIEFLFILAAAYDLYRLLYNVPA